MRTQITVLLRMSLPIRLITLRKENSMTQQTMADTIGIHVNSLKKYEARQAQPSLDVLKKLQKQCMLVLTFCYLRNMNVVPVMI